MPVEWNQATVMAAVRRGAVRGVMIGATLVHERGTHLILTPPKTGRVYPRRGVRHQASAPGEAPASDTGRLAASGQVMLDAGNVAAHVNWSTKYARPLELGTEKMAARPYARRALTEMRNQIQAAIVFEIEREFR